MVTERKWNIDDKENFNFVYLAATMEERLGDTTCGVTVSEVAMHLFLHGNVGSSLNQT
jgi:hypothetical protein